MNCVKFLLTPDWQATGPIKPSVLMPVMTTIEQSLVVRAMVTLPADDLQTMREAIAHGIG